MPDFQPLTRVQLAALVQRQLAAHVVDDSSAQDVGAAIYTLSDPRELRAVRYVGQTTAPARRYRQHLEAARLWLPDALPWWIASPTLLPLYTWLRELHRDDYRLPVMRVVTWVAPRAARRVEREQLCECLARGCDLLNVEQAMLGYQLPLRHHDG